MLLCLKVVYSLCFGGWFLLCDSYVAIVIIVMVGSFQRLFYWCIGYFVAVWTVGGYRLTQGCLCYEFFHGYLVVCRGFAGAFLFGIGRGFQWLVVFLRFALVGCICGLLCFLIWV